MNKEYCPKCGSEATKITRGVPSYAFCENNHQWDRSNNHIVDLNKKVDKLKKENQALRELVKYSMTYVDKATLREIQEKLKEIGGK